MYAAETLSLESIAWLVAASDGIRFESQDHGLLYKWVEQVLVGQEYRQLGKAARGLVRRSIEKMTGLIRFEVTRLIEHLDIFVEAGWPAALRFLYGLSDVVRG